MGGTIRKHFPMSRRIFNSDSRFVLIILLPIVLLIALFIYYPAVDTFGTSLTNRNLRIRNQKPKAVGLNNYIKLVEDEEFWEVTGRSFKVVALTLPLEMAVAFGIAMLLNQRFPGRGIMRTLTILPWMLPPVVNGFLWGWLLNGEYGALNGFLYQFGLIQEYQYWLRAPETQILWVAVVQTWTRYAFPTIILLAGLQSIPDDLLMRPKWTEPTRCRVCASLPFRCYCLPSALRWWWSLSLPFKSSMSSGR